MNFFHDLFERRLVLVSGKGGTGKTLVAASLAAKAVQQGKRVLLVEYASKGQIPNLFDQKEAGHSKVTLGPNLWSINLCPKECFTEYVVKHLGLPRLYDRVFRNKIVRSFIEAIPSLNEVMILGWLYSCCEVSKDYDLVIFDCPASGHFLNLITTPGAVISTGLGGPIIANLKKIDHFIKDSRKCGAVVVTLPEKLVCSETMEFVPLIKSKGKVQVLAVMMNCCCPDFQEQKEALLDWGEKYKPLRSTVNYILKKYETIDSVQQN